jgi:molybdenum cofactor biosynthesis protein B
MSETSKTHKTKAPKTLTYAVYICSTSRYSLMQAGEANISDLGGDTIVELLKTAGQNVLFKRIIPDDKTLIAAVVTQALKTPELDVVIFSGGTGIAPTDVTIETVQPFFEKTLPGFGEFFRRISFDRVGSAAVLSRATAGVASGKVLFCIPGSPDAGRGAVEMLILPEAAHIVKHAREQK